MVAGTTSVTYTLASLQAMIHAAIPEGASVALVTMWASDAALEYRLETLPFLRQIKQESNFRYDIVQTRTLCYGPGQLHPTYYEPELFAHPRDNLNKSAELMASYRLVYGSLDKALAAYNCGPGRLNGILADHPADWRNHLPNETKLYLDVIVGKEIPVSGFKLSWHYINIPTACAEQTARAVEAHPGLMVKVLNPPRQNVWPGARVIGRTWIGGDQAEQAYINAGDARGYLAHWQSAREACPYVHAWELCNEPPVATQEQRKRLNDFLYKCHVISRSEGWLTVGGNLSVGWPAEPSHILDLKDAARACDYWAVHEYGWTPENIFYPYHLTRYRKYTLEPLATVGIVPKLLITECGMDGGVAGKPGKGWKEACGRDVYQQFLKGYADELAEDPAVEAAFVFTSGPTDDWKSFDVDAELSRWMADAHVAATPTQTLEQAIIQAAQQHVIPYNMTAALAHHLHANEQCAIQSREFTVEHGGQKYVCQVGRPGRVKISGQVVAFCRDGDWGNVRVVEAPDD